MIFERISLSLIAVLACLVLLESPPVRGALAQASESAANLQPLCGWGGGGTGH